MGILDGTLDSEVDSAEYSPLIYNIDVASTFRKDTLDYIESCLAIDRGSPGSNLPSNTVIASFAPIGETIREVYSDREPILTC